MKKSQKKSMKSMKSKVLRVVKHRRRGRPKGSRNKPKSCKLSKLSKSPSKMPLKRSTKVLNGVNDRNAKYVKQVFPFVKSYKFLGFCRCNGIISEKNLVSKFIYLCPTCGKKARIKVLKKANIDESQPKSKKEYLAEEVHKHIDYLPLNEHVIDVKDFKVMD